MKHPKITNLEGCRNIATTLLYLDPDMQYAETFGLVNHPVFSSVAVVSSDGKFIDMRKDRDGFEKVRADYADRMRKATLSELFCMILSKYHSAFLKYAGQYMSKNDFDTYLGDVWTHSENPNQDANVSIATFKRWFRSAERKTLMEKDERKVYNALPDTVEVYRGVAVGRAKGKGLSWTCNYDTAEWFAHRFDRDNKTGYILKGKVKKEDVFAYFNRRDEDEICCDSSKIFDLEKV